MAQRPKANLPAQGRPGNIAPARAAAFAILQRVATTAAHSDDLLHAPAVNALSAEDRNLTTTLVLGVLRWQMALDARVRPLLQRPDAELHPAALLALRLGIFQLEYLERIPAHAAINESVELARANGAAHAAGMVNALLRRMMRDAEREAPARRTLAAASPAEIAHPAWLLQRWRARYGGKATRLLCAYDQAEPPQHGLFRSEASAPSDSPAIDGTEDADEDADDSAAAATLPRIDDGSRLVAEIAAAAAPQARRILDCCAAPGGKTLVLAHRLREAEIVAADVNERRLTAMRKRLEHDHAGSRVKIVLADMTARHVPSRVEAQSQVETRVEAGTESSGETDGSQAEPRRRELLPAEAVFEGGPPLEQAAESAGANAAPSLLRDSFDLVLCDAPCSGTGTLARNPEIRHRLREGDLPRQAERQTALLRNALRRLAPGGRLVYSTCSMEPEENEAVVAVLLSEGVSRIVPVSPLLRAILTLQEDARTSLIASAVTAEGALRTIPGVQLCDGFYAVVLERVERDSAGLAPI